MYWTIRIEGDEAVWGTRFIVKTIPDQESLARTVAGALSLSLQRKTPVAITLLRPLGGECIAYFNFSDIGRANTREPQPVKIPRYFTKLPSRKFRRVSVTNMRTGNEMTLTNDNIDRVASLVLDGDWEKMVIRAGSGQIRLEIEALPDFPSRSGRDRV